METITVSKEGTYSNKKWLSFIFYAEGHGEDSSAISLEHEFEEGDNAYLRIELSLDELDKLADKIKKHVASVRNRAVDNAH